jgi:uncharacterized protein YgbK (DUF1537 family)
MNEQPIAKDKLFASLPPLWPESLLEQIRTDVEAKGQRFVVLDDDPTGTQSVHGLPVLTEWSVASLTEELKRSPVFYLLTNSRALTRDEAVGLAREIGHNLIEAGRLCGRSFAVGSRSDSTLRGHFPSEVDAMAEVLADGDTDAFTGYVITPYFAEGGRYTVDNIHYVQQGDMLVPAAQTEFAQDRVFGYQHSSLPEWVEEKTGGRVKAADVVCITLDDLRVGGPEAVTAKLMAMPQGGAAIMNSTHDRDQEVFVAGLLAAEQSGRRFLYRTAASFVRVRGGIPTKPLLAAAETRGDSAQGGLVVVGSYVAKSSEQLQHALDLPGVVGQELNVDALLDAGTAEPELDRVQSEIHQRLAHGDDVVLYTSRTLRTGTTDEENQEIGKTVSAALCQIVANLKSRPRFLIAKGGITSSDVATQGLGVRRAMVLGALLPGVPVWELGDESLFPGMHYVVFPGNVGQPDGVAEAIRLFRRS